MDSNNTKNSKVKQENEFDIRDIANFLLGKLWIILLAIICFAVVAIIFTSTITPLYKSEATLFIAATGDSSSLSQASTGLNLGKQLVVSSPELVTLDFCQKVIDEELLTDADFVQKFGNSITAQQLLSYISVSPDQETNVVTFSASTSNPAYSKALVNAVTRYFEEYIKIFASSFMDGDNIGTIIAQEGVENHSSINIHKGRNAALAGIAGALVACVILIVIFIFDDKIKTPDDIDRYLEVSVLGVIPEIDVEG